MDILRYVKSNMTGRMCDEQSNVRYLLEVVREAGDGNYLEIGTLHGGTLCAVALYKKELGHKGKCYSIDPLNGYYMDYLDVRKRGCEVDPITRLPVSMDTLMENVRKFDIEKQVKIHQSKSDPYPVDKRVKFSVAYIDGDHWGDAPTIDWRNIKDRVTHFVVFDNYDALHPDVMRACEEARNDAEWGEFLKVGITYAVRRRA